MSKLASYLPHKLSNSPLYKKINTIENKTIFCTADPALMVREINTIILLQIYHTSFQDLEQTINILCCRNTQWLLSFSKIGFHLLVSLSFIDATKWGPKHSLNRAVYMKLGSNPTPQLSFLNATPTPLLI